MRINESLLLILISCFSVSLFAQSSDQTGVKPNTVKIEIWSDVVCPFCYLGKKKVEQAINKLNATDKVEVIWHSFQLDPDFPANTSVPSIQNLSERKGYPLDQVKDMCASLAQDGKAYQIDFNFDQALSFNTRDAHRLIQWAKTVGKSSEAKEALMKAYFSEGVDLSKQKNLLDVVAQAGLDRQKAQVILESDAYVQEVEQDILRSQQLGVQGVPFFLVNDKQGISGAQSDHVFEQVIGDALEGMISNEKH